MRNRAFAVVILLGGFCGLTVVSMHPQSANRFVASFAGQHPAIPGAAAAAGESAAPDFMSISPGTRTTSATPNGAASSPPENLQKELHQAELLVAKLHLQNVALQKKLTTKAPASAPAEQSMLDSGDVKTGNAEFQAAAAAAVAAAAAAAAAAGAEAAVRPPPPPPVAESGAKCWQEMKGYDVKGSDTEHGELGVMGRPVDCCKFCAEKGGANKGYSMVLSSGTCWCKSRSPVAGHADDKSFRGDGIVSGKTDCCNGLDIDKVAPRPPPPPKLNLPAGSLELNGFKASAWDKPQHDGEHQTGGYR